MSLHKSIANITKSYAQVGADAWACTELVNHQGVVIAFAQTQGGAFFSSLLNLSDPRLKSARDVEAWSANPAAVPFPVEFVDAGAEVASLAEMPVFRKNGATPREAVAMASALSCTEARPWRIMHRVTFVRRVHAPVGGVAAESSRITVNETMISSNYELIQLLKPYVVGQQSSHAAFEKAITSAVTAHYPALAGKVDGIVKLMGAYYEIYPPDAQLHVTHVAAGGADALRTTSAPPASSPGSAEAAAPTPHADDGALAHADAELEGRGGS